MSGQHREGPPEDCASCRKVFAVVAGNHQADPDVRLTTTQIGERCGLGERATYVHLSHLFRHRRVKADRRTPVAGATVRKGGEVPPAADSVMWAANQATADRTCGLLLTSLAKSARGAWSGQTTMEWLAGDAGLSLRTVERHRPHLAARKVRDAAGAVRSGLVEFTADTVLSRNGRHRVRRGDRFRFLAGRDARALAWNPAESLVDPREFEGTARALVDAVRWFVGPPADFAQAYRRVSLLLARGHAPEDLLRALTSRTPDSGAPAYRVLSAWLPSLDDDPTPSAHAAVQAGAALMACTDCGARVQPHPSGLCKTDREDRAARGQLPVPVARVAQRQCHDCRKSLTNSPVPFFCDGCGADQRVPA
ncbi:hypothetical protein [Streptomyces sp. NPDC002580]|uniref:hypothetical protein n=1 Tax=Streptomyces sp. NPDC002580 TaxID=3364653 RepID=UPI0036A54A02